MKTTYLSHLEPRQRKAARYFIASTAIIIVASFISTTVLIGSAINYLVSINRLSKQFPE